MNLSPASVAALTLLNDALDEPNPDLTQTLHYVATGASTAVASYVGMSVCVEDAAGPEVLFTALEDGIEPGTIATSLRLTFTTPSQDQSSQPGHSRLIWLVLYATTPGAFVDLTADLAWLANPSCGEYVLDEDVPLAKQPHSLYVTAASTINQAIGILIGRGATPEEASEHLDHLAVGQSTDRLTAAAAIISQL
jgi:hypothetical protein